MLLGGLMIIYCASEFRYQFLNKIKSKVSKPKNNNQRAQSTQKSQYSSLLLP